MSGGIDNERNTGSASRIENAGGRHSSRRVSVYGFALVAGGEDVEVKQLLP